jgi:hypothetical protein
MTTPLCHRRDPAHRDTTLASLVGRADLTTLADLVDRAGLTTPADLVGPAEAHPAEADLVTRRRRRWTRRRTRRRRRRRRRRPLMRLSAHAGRTDNRRAHNDDSSLR